jgi:hypothetical protein
MPAIVFCAAAYIAFTRGHHIDLLYAGLAGIVSSLMFLVCLIVSIVKRKDAIWWLATAFNSGPIVIYLFFVLISVSI